MLITVAIPTHNRPELLNKALESVREQSYRNWEVVVVDDGSSPPVERAMIQALLGDKFKLVRHDVAQGIAAAKNAGVAAASGDIVLHLDDDDLLAGAALATFANVFSSHSALECVFVNTRPFGRYEEGSRKNQEAALSRLLERAGGREEGGVLLFGERLFGALLTTVPIAFQRPVARRGAWQKVGELRVDLDFPEPEWALRAALACTTGFIRAPLFLWRVDGQNYASRADKKFRQIEANIRTKQGLLDMIRRRLPESRPQLQQVRQALSRDLCGKAYTHYWSGNRMAAWSALLNSLVWARSWRQVRLGMRILLPRNFRGKGSY